MNAFKVFHTVSTKIYTIYYQSAGAFSMILRFEPIRFSRNLSHIGSVLSI